MLYNALSGGRKPKKCPFPLGFRHPEVKELSHGHRQHAQKIVKIAPVVRGICFADREDTHTHTHTRAHHNNSRWRNKN